MIYLIDHEDSFTFNLAHLLSQFDKVFVSNYYNINSKATRYSSRGGGLFLLKFDEHLINIFFKSY